MTTQNLILVIVASGLVLILAWSAAIALIWRRLVRERRKWIAEAEQRHAAARAEIEDRIHRGVRQTKERFKL